MSREWQKEWPREWIEIKARGPGASKGAAIEALIKAGSPGVQEDTLNVPSNLILSHSSWAAPDDERDEEAVAGKNAVVRLRAYLEPAFAGIEQLEKYFRKIGWSFSSSVYRDKDWSVKWRARLRPVRVAGGNRAVVVKPGWKTVKKRPGDIVIEIDPGMAFGTGGHETTRMCLKALLWILKRGRVKPSLACFLDVGTGSGVLAIAAKRLGVKKAAGIDIDRVALSVARRNARINKTKVTISKKPLEEVSGRFSIVAANIISRELKRLAPALVKRVATGGWLVLSGILEHEKKDIIEMYSTLGLDYVKGYSRGEWAAAVFYSSDRICG